MALTEYQSAELLVAITHHYDNIAAQSAHTLRLGMDPSNELLQSDHVQSSEYGSAVHDDTYCDIIDYEHGSILRVVDIGIQQDVRGAC